MSYYRYWGKAKPAEEGAPYHLLPYHSLDVAAVGWHLLAPERALTQRMATQLEMTPEALQRFFVFPLGIHDAAASQRQRQPRHSGAVIQIMRSAMTADGHR